MSKSPTQVLRPTSGALLAAIVESATDAIISKDLNSIITSWNPAAERLFGYTAQEAVGQPVTILFPPDLIPEEDVILARIKRGERLERYESVRRHKNGTLIDVSLTVSPVRDEDGRIVGASKIVHDLREQRRLQQRFAVTLASIGDGVIATDIEGRIVFMNAVAERLTGWPEAEATGKSLVTVFNIVNESTRRPVESPVGRVLRSGVTEGLANHTLLIAKDGTERPIDDSAAPIREPHGDLMGVVLVFRDVSERRKAQLASLRLAAIVEGSDDAIVGKNLRGIITSWNRGAERIFGYAAEEVIGQSIMLLIPPERSNEEHEILARLQRGDRVEHFETVRVRKDGRQIHVSLTISPIRDRDGTIVGASKIARDITPQKDAERALQQAQRQLQSHAQTLENEVRLRTTRLHEMVAELDAFSYSLSHDLRAPLRSIQGFSDLLLTDVAPKVPEAKEYLTRILHAAERMERLIQDVLAFSRVARAEISVRPVDLAPLIAAIIHDRLELQSPHAEVEIVHPLRPVLGRDASLTQVMANLLANAVKFVPRGTVPRVRISTEARGGRVRLRVSDNGIGIEPSLHGRLFRMFERLPTPEPYQGTGVGLAIVRKAAERMQGSVGVESAPGQGSTFWIELPAADT